MKYKLKYIKEIIKKYDVNKPLNTRIQKSGMGKIANSHALRVGKGLGQTALNRHEKMLDNIYKQRGDEMPKEQDFFASIKKDNLGEIHIIFKNEDYTLKNIKDNPTLYKALKDEQKGYKDINDCLNHLIGKKLKIKEKIC